MITALKLADKARQTRDPADIRNAALAANTVLFDAMDAAEIVAELTGSYSRCTDLEAVNKSRHSLQCTLALLSASDEQETGGAV